jgi:alpha-mannosidase
MRSAVSVLGLFAVAAFLLGAAPVRTVATPRPASEAATAMVATAAKLSEPLPGAGDQLYVVSTAHLDTQWRWTIQETINDFIPATLRRNFELFEKYPDYVFSFEGAFRYMLMKEYYPDDYARMKDYIAAGRWRVTGSWVDAVDTNIPSPESLIRHALLGQGYFRREFNVTSRDVFLPDCFGFGYALPSIAAHCGILGFSTQKLTWGSSVGVPFDIGIWQGVDGSRLFAALNPGAYVSEVKDDLSADTSVVAAIARQVSESGYPAAFKYVGTGDQGGAPTDSSILWLTRSIREPRGPVRVRSTGADQFARDLATMPAEVVERLPLYDGELLMTRHGAGCYTSQSAMKRWNRKNERLADAAERASVIADWIGAARYPQDVLDEAWVRFLWHQFHDDLTGTSIPQAYLFSWNDEAIAENQFASILTNAVGGVTRALDTNVKGIPLVVYNPLSFERTDVVEAQVDFADAGATGAAASGANTTGARGAGAEIVPRAIRVFGPDGVEVPSQAVLDTPDPAKRILLDAPRPAAGPVTSARVTFVATVPSVGFAVYDIRSAAGPSEIATDLAATTSTLTNRRYAVHIDPKGDIDSIVDRPSGRELLAAPIRLQLLDDSPRNWAAWEVDFDDVMAPPREYVEGGAPAEDAGRRADDSAARGGPSIRLIENGPARATIEIVRSTSGSTFRQYVRLGAGAAGERIEIVNDIDWRTPGTLLKAAFPLAASAETATYDLGMGTIDRPANSEKKYEVPAQQWADVTDRSGEYGVAILNDCKYGWDKPDDHTLRLTLIHTPEVNKNWRWIDDQRSMDIGHHVVTTAVYGHAGDWTGGAPAQADRLNQPLRAFQARPTAAAGAHATASSAAGPVPVGRAFSFLDVSNPAVAVRAVKRAEESDETIVRLQELNGSTALDVHVRFARPIVAAREVNGAEEPIGPCVVRDGRIVADLASYQPRTFAVRLADPPATFTRPLVRPLDIPFNLLGITEHGNRNEADFDGSTRTIPGDLLPPTVLSGDVPFVTGPRGPMQANMLACAGQQIDIPAGDFDHLYILASSVGGDRRARFLVDGVPTMISIQDCEEPIAQWNNRVASSEIQHDPARIEPAYTKSDPIAWVGTHRHRQDGDRDAYEYFYLFRYAIDITGNARVLTLPDDYAVRIAAITASRDPNAVVAAAQPLFDRPAATLARIDAPGKQFLDPLRITLRSPVGVAVIHYTMDGTEPDERSPEYREPFTLTESADIRARAFAPGMNNGYVADATFTKLELRDAVTPSKPLEAGLAVRYYEGKWEKLPDFGELKPLRTAVIPDVRIPAFAKSEFIALSMNGFIRVPTDGMYTFHLWSDDGSALYVGDEKVVDNDGPHGKTERTEAVALRAGLHAIRLEFYQGVGDESLQLEIEGPGMAVGPVTPEMLVH